MTPIVASLSDEDDDSEPEPQALARSTTPNAGTIHRVCIQVLLLAVDATGAELV